MKLIMSVLAVVMLVAGVSYGQLSNITLTTPATGVDADGYNVLAPGEDLDIEADVVGGKFVGIALWDAPATFWRYYWGGGVNDWYSYTYRTKISRTGVYKGMVGGVEVWAKNWRLDVILNSEGAPVNHPDQINYPNIYWYEFVNVSSEGDGKVYSGFDTIANKFYYLGDLTQPSDTGTWTAYPPESPVPGVVYDNIVLEFYNEVSGMYENGDKEDVNSGNYVGLKVNDAVVAADDDTVELGDDIVLTGAASTLFENLSNWELNYQWKEGATVLASGTVTPSQAGVSVPALNIGPRATGAYNFTLVVSSGAIVKSDTATVTVEDTTPPEVFITHPDDGDTLNSAVVTVSADADDLSGVASVEAAINKVYLPYDPIDGDYSGIVLHSLQDFTITVTATDNNGNQASDTVTVKMQHDRGLHTGQQ